MVNGKTSSITTAAAAATMDREERTQQNLATDHHDKTTPTTQHAQVTKELKDSLRRYYRQLISGCGRLDCTNEYCASSGKFPKLTSNGAAARALLCLRDKAPFCDTSPKWDYEESINEDRIKEIFKRCREANDWTMMKRFVEYIFGSRDVLLRSFVTPDFADKISKGCEQTTEVNTPKMNCQQEALSMQPPCAPRKRRAIDCCSSAANASPNNTPNNNISTDDSTPQQHNTNDNTHHNDTDDETMITSQQMEQQTTESTEVDAIRTNNRGASADGSVNENTPTTQHDHSSVALRRINVQPANVTQSGSNIDTVVSTASNSLTRSASDLGTSHPTSRADHCNDCGWRNIVVEDKDAQTESMDISDKKTNAEKNDDKSNLSEENTSVLSALRSGRCPTDMEAAKRCFDILFEMNDNLGDFLQNAMGSVAKLCNAIEFQLRYERAWERNPAGIVHLMNLLFSLPFVQWFEFIDVGLMPLCKMCTNLGNEGQMTVASVWANFEAEWLQDHIGMLQQAITIRVLTVIDAVGSLPRFTDRIEPLPTAVQTLSILYKAVLIKAKRSTEQQLPRELLLKHQNREQRATPLPSDAMDTSEDAVTHDQSALNDSDTQHLESPFLKALRARDENDDDGENRAARMAEIDAWAVTNTCFPLTEFINTSLSENFSVEDDFVAYKSFQNGRAFSVLPEYSFVLSLEAKQRFLIIYNRIKQRSERRHAIADAITYGVMIEPYLRLAVRRSNVVRDALDGLSAVAFDNVGNFRKQLRVYFDDEQAVDEGGVSKEFYQLITQQLFCPDYGMFIFNEKSGLYWFNSQCTFCDDEYGLIGLLFGLAIYNNILVDVRFPIALYTKLLARPAQFDELDELDPDLYRGLTELLACEDDVENIYCYSFEISYKDAFGHTHAKELIPNGKNIRVTNENKKEFVLLYADFLLNVLVKRQFEAFSAGFVKVANQGLLRRLCQPQEVEELVCGVLDLNFDILAKSTRYQNGYSESSQTIRDLWTVTRAMTIEEKKMFLQFITGSDRVPVGGLAKLDVTIARNGDDKKRLPTAHTCYNIMLLPDYCDLEVTKERLLKAISYSRGFGLQ